MDCIGHVPLCGIGFKQGSNKVVRLCRSILTKNYPCTVNCKFSCMYHMTYTAYHFPFPHYMLHWKQLSPKRYIFTALHVMQTRYSDENSVRPSVCPSVTRVHCDKTVERSVQIYIPYERTFSLVFWEEEWLVGATPSTWNFGLTGPRWSKIADFEPIIARSASAVTPSEKSSINANRKSTIRASQWA